jgi:hypothetical protein
MTASLSSYPIVLIDKFCSITFSCPPTSSTHDSTRELTSLALWSTNHVQDQQIVEPTKRGHTLSCSMRGFFRAEERTSVMRMRLTGGTLSAEELDQNRALRILSVWGERQRAACASCTFRRNRRPMCSSGAILTRAYATDMMHQMIHRPS